jgi:hypothetical protein
MDRAVCHHPRVGSAILLAVAAAMVWFGDLVSAQNTNVGGRSSGLTYASGQSVVPIFGGWSENADGSFDLHFSYLNRNWVEELDVPVGPDNRIDPLPFGPDAGQPTHFLPRNNRWQFTVRVPADFGNREVVWTLTSRGQTYRAYGVLDPGFVIDDFGIQHEFGSDSTPGRQPPALRLEIDSRKTGRVGERIALVAVATDPNPVRPRARVGPARAEGAAGGGDPAIGGRDAGQVGPGAVGGDSVRTSATGLRFAWYVYRGKGAAVTFDPPMPFKVWEDQRGGSPWSPGWQPPPIPPGNKWSYDVTFGEPGTYVLRALAHNGSKFTYKDVRFTIGD